MMFTGTGAARNTIVSLIMGLSIWPITLQAYKMLGISAGGYYPTLDMSFPAIMVFLLLFAWFIVIQMFVLLAIELIMPSGTLSSIIRNAPKIPTWYRRLNRLAQIQKILIKFGLSRHPNPRIPSLRVSLREIASPTRDALAASGLTFLKPDQFLATRGAMIPLLDHPRRPRRVRCHLHQTRPVHRHPRRHDPARVRRGVLHSAGRGEARGLLRGQGPARGRMGQARRRGVRRVRRNALRRCLGRSGPPGGDLGRPCGGGEGAATEDPQTGPRRLRYRPHSRRAPGADDGVGAEDRYRQARPQLRRLPA